MSDSAVSEQAGISAEPTAGVMLRQAREATGLHIAALAVSLKVSVRKLEALEADRLDELHDAVFVRGLASAVCRSLRIEAAPILARLPQRSQPMLMPDPSDHDVFQPGPGTRLAGWSSGPPAAALWVVGALLVGAGVLAFWPELRQWGQGLGWLNATSTSAPAATPTPSPAAMAPGNDMAVESVNHLGQTASAPQSPASAVTIDMPAAVAIAPPTSVAPPGAAASNAVAGTTAVAATGPSAASAADGVLRMSASAATWVEVLDRFGAVAYKGTIAAGESVLVGGRVPLAVTVGRADGVSVQVRGQAFDLTPVTRANVAHFEVK